MDADGKAVIAAVCPGALNISRSYYELENFDQASAWYDKAATADTTS